MQCGQGKPFTVTSTNSKMGSVAVRSYEKGGVVTKSNPEDTKKTARQIARDIDSEQTTPVTNKYIETVAPRITNIKNEYGRALATGFGLAGMSVPLTADLARAAVTGRKPRSNEDLNELTREVAKGSKK